MYFSIRLLFTCVSGGSPPYSPYTNHATLFLHAAHVALARLCGQCADAQLQAPRIRLRYVTVHGVAPSVVWPCESRLLDRSARVSVSVPTPTNSISGVSTHTSAVSASPRASAQCVLYWLFAAPFIGSTLGPHSPTQSFSIAPHTTRAGYYTHKHAHTHTSCTAIHSCRHAAHQHTPFFPPPYAPPSPPPALLTPSAVFIANLFMLGFCVEALTRGRSASETCDYPLGTYLIMQIIFVVLLQIMAPLCLVLPKKPHLLSPALSLSMFLLQWLWLLVGWVWVLSPSNCEFEAPYLFSGALWTVIVYSVAVPMETIWYMRIYIAFWKTNPKGCDCPCISTPENTVEP